MCVNRMESAMNQFIVNSGIDTNKISDGYHSFYELYEHRIALYIALCRIIERNYATRIWKSKKHDDGSEWPGWFILGINDLDGFQISYHLPNEKWDECDFAETLRKAPAYDGHKPEDVLHRLTLI